MKLHAIFRRPSALATIAFASALVMAACGGGGSGSNLGSANCPATNMRIPLAYGGGGGGSGQNCPPVLSHPTPAAGAAAVGLLLTGESMATVATYGGVLGFFNGVTPVQPTGSGVVNLTAATNVQFLSFEPATGGLVHTASFIQTWGGSFPASPTIPATASAAGMSISSPSFSSGPLNPGSVSAVYTSGGPGIFIFGCAFHYVTNGMRTIVIVT